MIGFPVVGHVKSSGSMACLLARLFMAFPVLKRCQSGLHKYQQGAKISTRGSFKEIRRKGKEG